MKGLIGKKIGMTQFFGADGSVISVTVIQTGPCVVVQKKEVARDGYNALQLGFGSKKIQRLNKAEQGHLRKPGKGAFEVLREFRLEVICLTDDTATAHYTLILVDDNERKIELKSKNFQLTTLDFAPKPLAVQPKSKFTTT